MTAVPAQDLLPVATRAQALRALRELVRGHRLLAISASALLIGATASGLVVPAVLGHIVNLVLDRRGPGSITAPVVLLVVLAIIQALLTAVGGVFVARLGEAMLARLRERVVGRALELPLEQVERAGSGDLISRVSGDVSVVADAVRTALPAFLQAGLTIGLTIVGLAVLDWRFALAALLAAPIQLHTLRWYLRRSAPVYAAERIAQGSRAQQLIDSMGASETVRAFGLSPKHIAAVDARSGEALTYALRANYLATRFFGRLNLAEFVGTAAILATGFWLVRADLATVGAAAAAALYFHRIFDPVNTLLGLFDTAQEAGAGLVRLVGVAEAPRPVEAVDTQQPADGTIDLCGVGFRYDTGDQVLSDIDLRVSSGEHVALVGESGAGKTTLAKLVAGIHPVLDGTIAIGGVPITSIPVDELRASVALVTQEVHVFSGPLAEDLRLAAPSASDAEVHRALELVHALDWAQALPDGLATVVGQGGHPLSATQAQQIALARLILADPAIALLDEATADAGSAGARLLDRAAENALRGRTALVVAHRLSQSAAADHVLVLDKGRLAETGTHTELVDAGGAYAQLWAAWSGARQESGADRAEQP